MEESGWIPFYLNREDAKNPKMRSRGQPHEYFRVRLRIGSTNGTSDSASLAFLAVKLDRFVNFIATK